MASTSAWTSLSQRRQAFARTIAAWARGQGAAVSTSEIGRDLDGWAEAFRAGALPDGTPMVVTIAPVVSLRPSLTVAEAAVRLGIQEATVIRYVRAGKLTAAGNRVTRASVEAWDAHRTAVRERFAAHCRRRAVRLAA